MSDQNQEEVLGENPPEGSQPELTPVQQKAMEMGWRPQDDWDGDPDDWVDAKEFVGRQKLYDRLDNSNKQIKELRKAIDDFKKLHENVKETEYKRALQVLRQEKIRMIQEGEAEQVVEIDDKIDEVKENLRKAQEAPKAPDIDPEFQRTFNEWQERNSWYKQDPMMKREADTWGYAYVQMNGPSVAPEEVLKKIEQEMKKRYPEKFVNPRKTETPKVETSEGKGKGTRGSNSDVVLTEDETRAMNRFVRNGIMTKEQYMAEIKRVRESA